MDNQHPSEWWKLQEDARTQIGANEGLLQLITLPSFENACSYAIFRETDRKKPVMYKLHCKLWRRDIDVEKFRTPLERVKYPHKLFPTIETIIRPLENTWTENILARFTSIAIPPWVSEHYWGQDGVTYELRFEEPFFKAHYRWWVEAPEAWKLLADAFHSTINDIELILQNLSIESE